MCDNLHISEFLKVCALLCTSCKGNPCVLSLIQLIFLGFFEFIHFNAMTTQEKISK